MSTLADVPAYPADHALGRDHAFGAHRRDERGYILKQDNGSGDVAHEAQVYQALAGEPRLRPHLPRYHGYDAADRVLTLGDLPDAVDLGSYHDSRRRPPVTVAAAISSIPDSSLVAQRPIETIRPALLACWDGYVTTMGMKGEAPQRFLATTLPFAAVRLVQTALESAQASPRPTTNQMLHLQVAHNILERPQEAVTQLLGPFSAGSGHRRA